ncbi:TIR domain-containing protein [Streptomyces sp. NPDC005329]|uniref:TIR domain-containing protein n=1 Tax=Streptomyces sp. NPDC005329 TaxID=3157034 RepID=UPI0033A3AEB6
MTYESDLRRLSAALDETAAAEKLDDIRTALENAEKASGLLADCWSGSSFGFHARVYYAGFEPPPAGAHFSSEWGFEGIYQGTTGEWQEYSVEVIENKLKDLQNGTSLEEIAIRQEEAESTFKTIQAEAESILSSYLAYMEDDYISEILKSTKNVAIKSAGAAAYSFLPTGKVMSRDSTAISQGLHVAQHQKLWAEAAEIRSTFKACRDLKFLVDRAANHIERRSHAPAVSARQLGERVFIGHGRSPLWRELKDFVAERLKLPYDEFNRVPVAGVTTVARIAEMMDRAAFAFLIMTAEDETGEGALRARQNVIHEVGLFQGRLGFERAIVMLEEGCESFSNIDGLSQIIFPKGQIASRFEEVRLVLEREGLLDG